MGLVRGAVAPIVTQGLGLCVGDCGAPTTPSGLVPRVQCIRGALPGHKPRGGGLGQSPRWKPRDGSSAQRVWSTVGCLAWTLPGQSPPHAAQRSSRRGEEPPRHGSLQDDVTEQMGAWRCRGQLATTGGGLEARGAP